jgi:N-acetylmuramoyl-L-alanine amidase
MNLETLEVKLERELGRAVKLGKALVIAGVVLGTAGIIHNRRAAYLAAQETVSAVQSKIQKTKKQMQTTQPGKKIVSGLGVIPYQAIVLDPGHVGESEGASQPHSLWDVWKGRIKFKDSIRGNYIKEADLTWAITDHLYKLIRKNSPQTQVYLTVRQGESAKLLQKLANARSALARYGQDEAAFLSIHVNSGNGSGALALYSKSNVGDRSLGEVITDARENVENGNSLFANSKIQEVNGIAVPILAQLQKIGFKTQGVYEDAEIADQGEIGILRELPKQYHRAALLEIGFIDNEFERMYLQNFPDKVAEAIYHGLLIRPRANEPTSEATLDAALAYSVPVPSELSQVLSMLRK